MKRRIALSSLSLLAVFFACKAQDPRLAAFDKFNRATSYEEARPLVSGLLADQLDSIHSTRPEQVPALLKHLHVTSSSSRFVDAGSDASFLVLENAKSETSQPSTQSYLLARNGSDQWTIANRVMPGNVLRSLWTNQYSPAQFNQPSQCTVPGKAEGAMQSAIAIRSRDRIEVRLLPFPISAADLEYLKLADNGIPTASPAYQQSQLRLKHSECRVVFALDPSGRIHSINIGFDDATSGTSTLFQGPGWASLPASGTQASSQTGLPPEMKNLAVSDSSIKLETLGDLSSGSQSIHWNVKLDVPLWQKGL